ncbi:endonuclease domain-containing protein [Cellulophaga sp. Asnod2-G02]|uniref:endonuclease domain-containing protein n=1 Tax=Cellulophaga sp. Asnod2-G02 TaxID=3160572 RepID=UPI003865916E
MENKRNYIISYNPKLKAYARQLRNNSTLAEVLLWQKIKGKALGVEFHRQVPVNEFMVDFYCHEIQLAIEIDGSSHNIQYDNDCRWQNSLETKGVECIRFEDIAVKKELFSVLLALESKVEQLIKHES